MSLLTSVVLFATCLVGAEPSAVQPEKAPETKKPVKTFTNSKADLTGDRAERYVDFSFDYPADWELNRPKGDFERYFVMLRRSSPRKDSGFIVENLSVGFYRGMGIGDKGLQEEQKRIAHERMVAALKAEIAVEVLGSRVTGEGTTKIGAYEGYEVRFVVEGKQKENDPAKSWGRAVRLPNPNDSNTGVTLYILGSSTAPELKEEKDLGIKGELPIILKSFKFATAQPAKGPDAKKAVKTFTNSRTSLTGDRAAHYVDFSFDYPADWNLERPKGDRERNFVTAERSIKRKDGDYTLENLSVGFYSGKGTGDKGTQDELKTKVRDQLVTALKAEIVSGLPGSKVTGEGSTKIGTYEGYEVRFDVEIKQKEGDPVKLWARAVLLPNPDGSDKGVALFIVGTNVAPELKEEKDLGIKGELPIVLKSFRFGKPIEP